MQKPHLAVFTLRVVPTLSNPTFADFGLHVTNTLSKAVLAAFAKKMGQSRAGDQRYLSKVINCS